MRLSNSIVSGLALGLLASAGASVSLAQPIAAPGFAVDLVLGNLRNPQQVGVDGSGRVFVADSANGRILRVQGGSSTPIVTGIEVTPYFGTEIGPVALRVFEDGTFAFGEGGGLTGFEQIKHYDADGNLIRAFPGIGNGGNWAGLAVNPITGDLLASSANGDTIFAAPRTGNTWGNFSPFIEAWRDNLVAPTGLSVSGDTLYVAFYGGFGDFGYIATYDPATGVLLNRDFAVDLQSPTSMDVLPDGRLVISEYGLGETEGRISIIDNVTGEVTPIVTNLNQAAGVAVGPDGAIYFTVGNGTNTNNGQLYRIVPAPGALALLGLAGFAAARRRR
jgi:sugar lactone lactonase YvrE